MECIIKFNRSFVHFKCKFQLIKAKVNTFLCLRLIFNVLVERVESAKTIWLLLLGNKFTSGDNPRNYPRRGSAAKMIEENESRQTDRMSDSLHN